MANSNCTTAPSQAAEDEKEVTRGSLADIASDLESAMGHLDAMITLSREKLEISMDDSPEDILRATGLAQSALDAARKYLNEIKNLDHLLYEKAWALPVVGGA